MKTEKMTYETPVVKILSIQVEKGFASSEPASNAFGTESLPDLNSGGVW